MKIILQGDFFNWSPPQNYKFFESPKKLSFFSELEKNRVFLGTQKTCDFQGGSRVEKKTESPEFPKKNLVFFPLEPPPSKSQVPSSSFLPSYKGAITCHFSVGIGRGEQESNSSWDYKFFSIPPPLKSQVFKECLLLSPTKPHTEVASDSTFAAG